MNKLISCRIGGEKCCSNCSHSIIGGCLNSFYKDKIEKGKRNLNLYNLPFEELSNPRQKQKDCWIDRGLRRMSTKMIKGLVSKKKKRYQKDGFDLDLSYIGENVIAMGFPGENLEAFYRNNIDDVSRFLESKHCGKYKIYNLCSERSYDPQKFLGEVVNFPFKDHNPPSLSIIPAFCSDVQKWLQSGPDNVAVVHCKAGKGRTGVMICCYLLHSRKVSTAAEALSYYAKERTHDSKGVTIPSQRRYVEYYEKILKTPLQYTKRSVVLLELCLDGSLNITGSTGTIYVSLTQSSAAQDVKYTSGHVEWKKTGHPLRIVLSEPLTLCGDVKGELFVKNMMKKVRLFNFCFNTFFIDNEYPPPCTSLSSAHTATVRFTVQESSTCRNSSDNVREYERTMSCPQSVEHWTKLEDKFDELPKSPEPCGVLIFSKSQLDKVNKNLIPRRGDFVLSCTFGRCEDYTVSEDVVDTGGGGVAEVNVGNSLAKCIRSLSASTQSTTSTPPSRYSSSSSSCSCTEDDVSSEGSTDSTGALVHHHHHHSTSTKDYKLLS